MLSILHTDSKICVFVNTLPRLAARAAMAFSTASSSVSLNVSISILPANLTSCYVACHVLNIANNILYNPITKSKPEFTNKTMNKSFTKYHITHNGTPTIYGKQSNSSGNMPCRIMSRIISFVVRFFFFHFLIVAIGYTAIAANAKYAPFSNKCLTIYG